MFWIDTNSCNLLFVQNDYDDKDDNDLVIDEVDMVNGEMEEDWEWESVWNLCVAFEWEK